MKMIQPKFQGIYYGIALWLATIVIVMIAHRDSRGENVIVISAGRDSRGENGFVMIALRDSRGENVNVMIVHRDSRGAAREVR